MSQLTGMMLCILYISVLAVYHVGTVSCDEEPGSRLNRPAPKPVMQVLPRVQEPVAKSGVNTSTGPAPCPTDTSQLPPEVGVVVITVILVLCLCHS